MEDFFTCGSSVPVKVECEGGGQLLGWQGPWQCQVCRDIDCLLHRNYGSVRVLLRASGSWQSEGLFGHSFSIVLPVQALRGLPYLETFSVVQQVRHIEGPTCLGSYSVDRHIRHLKGQPGRGLTL